MDYFISPNGIPLELINCGQLVNPSGFFHPHRNLDTFVLIIGIRGTLHVYQGETEYNIGPQQHLLFFPGVSHGGVSAAEGYLSYYWCHFRVPGGYGVVQSAEEWLAGSSPGEYYTVPTYGEVKYMDRASILFRQMIDNSQENTSSRHYGNYALSMLVTEISRGAHFGQERQENVTQKAVSEIREWVRVNYANELTVQNIAWEFGYNANYLSHAFKQHTGRSLHWYISKTRVGAAKRILLDTALPVKTVSAAAGFKDEKNFMKTFKRLEGMTPSQYRNTFYKKHMNRE